MTGMARRSCANVKSCPVRLNRPVSWRSTECCDAVEPERVRRSMQLSLRYSGPNGSWPESNNVATPVNVTMRIEVDGQDFAAYDLIGVRGDAVQ